MRQNSNLPMPRNWTRYALCLCLAAAAFAAGAQAQGQGQGQGSAQGNEVNTPGDNGNNGNIVLRQQTPGARQQENGTEETETLTSRTTGEKSTTTDNRRTTYKPGEFELFVQRASGKTDVPVRRLGHDLVTSEGSNAQQGELSPLVPADYLVAPGDEVLVTLWGSVDADLRIIVDRSGRIFVPRVGSIQVSGVRSADLKSVVERRVAQVFKNFQLSVSLGQLRGIRVFVTGFVTRPGTYTVSSLSSVVTALMRAGGPSSAGSFRNITLRRGAQLVATLDLYDLLLRGDRSNDQVLQAGDVVFVGPVGPQVGFIGSVNRPAVIELKPGETVADAIRMVGGFTAVGDRTRLAVERLKDRMAQRVALLELPRDQGQTLGAGDILRAFSEVDFQIPTQRQSKRVRVEGEVQRPGEYILPQSSTIEDAIKLAGGLTPNAYLYATEFSRESVRVTQQENYDRVLRDMETEMARSTSAQRVTNVDEAAAQNARSSMASQLISRLRALKPTGRVILSLNPDAAALPNLALEDGDRIFVPPVPTTIGVFGSVFNAGSFLYSRDRQIGDYLRLAGGPTKGSDFKSAFVIRPNGSVVSALQQSSGFFSSGTISGLPAEAGDTIFVPEEMDKTSFIQNAKDWAQILSQFGLGIAAIRSVTR
ncbi:MAG: SLBB domain-containing protein [Burkholderiales bacterium]|nr:SLBB domain-containing protein [Burkholderiales bacterium]